jgi:hypothetical protein
MRNAGREAALLETRRSPRCDFPAPDRDIAYAAARAKLGWIGSGCVLASTQIVSVGECVLQGDTSACGKAGASSNEMSLDRHNANSCIRPSRPIIFFLPPERSPRRHLSICTMRKVLSRLLQ